MKIAIALVCGLIGFMVGIWACPFGVIYLGKNAVVTRTVLIGVQMDTASYGEHADLSHTLLIGGWKVFQHRLKYLFVDRGSVETVEPNDSAERWFNALPENEGHAGGPTG
jgi:hypothetical protein